MNTIVFVHGAVAGARASWSAQDALADEWNLVTPNRRGFYPGPESDVCDFDLDVEDLAPLLDTPVHLCGHSYGGVVALLLAARRPDRVRSLTLIEPAAFDVVRGRPDVEAFIATIESLLRDGPAAPLEFLGTFLRRIGGGAERIPSALTPELEQNIALLRRERPPWQARLPLEALRARSFPVLVASSGAVPIQELICDEVASRLDAARTVLPGAGHAVQRSAGFNEVYRAFLRRAEHRPAAVAAIPSPRPDRRP